MVATIGHVTTIMTGEVVHLEHDMANPEGAGGKKVILIKEKEKIEKKKGRESCIVSSSARPSLRVFRHGHVTHGDS